MSPRILVPLPAHDFDPSETGIPWSLLTAQGFELTFATPQGLPGEADPRMVTGRGLGPLAPLLAATADARAQYLRMTQSQAFVRPLRWEEIRAGDFDGLLLPGGHAKGMREYLESPILQRVVVDFMENNRPVGAICHGVLLAARSRSASGRSVLAGRKTTALLKMQELSAWLLTVLWLGDYYRTYPQTLEDEVRALLDAPTQFVRGPLPVGRDSTKSLKAGFALRDGNYVSARWPGDAHTFATRFAELF